MMLVGGTGLRTDPAAALALDLTGPNDQCREPAHKREPDYQHKDHKQILLSASDEGPGLNPGLSRLKLKCFAREPALHVPRKAIQ